MDIYIEILGEIADFILDLWMDKLKKRKKQGRLQGKQLCRKNYLQGKHWRR